MVKKPVTEEENARQVALKILDLLAKYNISERNARIIFDLIMNDYKYTSYGMLEVKNGK